MSQLPLFARAQSHGNAQAFPSHSYRELLDQSALLASALLGEASDLSEARVALLVPAGPAYVIAQWAIWRAGGIKLPICLSATEPEWEYALTDSGATAVLADQPIAAKIAPLCLRLGVRLLEVHSRGPLKPLPALTPDRRAMILYTSGTTSKPKGVTTTHANIQAQIESLVQAWEWTGADRIPLFLPLHHIHGIINITGCALWSGASIEAFARFDMEAILARVRAGAYTVFMAVPTIYVKLLQAIEMLAGTERAELLEGFNKMRLMVSGSAALPASIHVQWTELTGQSLLERYGMTEIGMALSNPLHGERRPGFVGLPLPGVEVRLQSDTGVTVEGEEEPGEIQVRGPLVARSYWNRPEVTAAAFDGDWFRTGDLAVRERGYFRILGRLSVDIIKSGGYKLSALEIEAVLLDHPAIGECAVVGLPDETWGEAVSAAVVLREGTSLDLAELRLWCRDRLSVYKIPHRLAVVAALPRNAMGKVTKPAVCALF